MSKITEHGENIAEQIQTEDAYGQFNKLSPADVWLIIDNLQTHFIDFNNEEMTRLLGNWMKQLEETDKDLPAI